MQTTFYFAIQNVRDIISLVRNMAKKKEKETKKVTKKKKAELKKLEKEYNASNEEEQVRRMLRIILGVVAFLALVWIGYSLVNGDLFKGKKEKEETVIQNDIILAGTTFNRPESEYYVLFYDFDGDNSTTCATIYTIYKNTKTDGKMFAVDLGDKLNSKIVVTDRSQVNTENAENLKVMDATLVKVKDGKVVETHAGIDELNSYKSTLLN